MRGRIPRMHNVPHETLEEASVTSASLICTLNVFHPRSQFSLTANWQTAIHPNDLGPCRPLTELRLVAALYTRICLLFVGIFTGLGYEIT
ncbi:hypothetical protein KQX54_021876 [Cotesia glomerata]|uniref:Uncharacterized protein n=1 Tax=Cotesia glomerata TaxID=32391 RepID=A0AAV7JAB6_COTGL|nr:hypothetical protein KQX54_021876 [Cotesia glomerata]